METTTIVRPPTLNEVLEAKAALHRPRQNYLIARTLHVKRGGLIVPQFNKTNALYMRVLRVGPGMPTVHEGQWTTLPMEAKVGDIILTTDHGPRLLPEETELYQLRETDIVTFYDGEVEEVDRADTVVTERAPAPSTASSTYNPEGVMIVMASPKTGTRKV